MRIIAFGVDEAGKAGDLASFPCHHDLGHIALERGHIVDHFAQVTLLRRLGQIGKQAELKRRRLQRLSRFVRGVGLVAKDRIDAGGRVEPCAHQGHVDEADRGKPWAITVKAGGGHGVGNHRLFIGRAIFGAEARAQRLAFGQERAGLQQLAHFGRVFVDDLGHQRIGRAKALRDRPFKPVGILGHQVNGAD